MNQSHDKNRTMKRRTFIALAVTLPYAAEAATAREWAARLVLGNQENGAQWAGLHINLADAWKTYWRVPGEAGVPPRFSVTGSDQGKLDVLFPTPGRIADASGEAIGYQGEVLFPMLIAPADIAKAEVSAFFGVCHDICKPARFSAALASAERDPDLISGWLKRVPTQGEFAGAARQSGDSLIIDLRQGCSDIFVEGPAGSYFRKPQFDGESATFTIDGLEPGEQLSGQKLRLTAIVGGQGLEQQVIVA